MSGVSQVGRDRPFAAGQGWVWGRLPDLLIGCGLGYILLMPAALWFATSRGMDSWPALVTIAVGLAISGPHYGATLLRAYDERHERRKYALFTVWISLAILALTAIGLHVLWIGSLLLTLYVTWAPWHFAGQNYGLALIFLGRRGIAIDPLTKRLLHLSFVLSAVISVLPLHSELQRVSYALEIDGQSDSIRLLRLGLSAEFVDVGLAVLGVLYAASLIQVAISLGRRAQRLRDLVPPALLVLTQALWYSLPRILEGATDLSLQIVVLTSIWISAAHALQYLWITSYFARRENAKFDFPAYLIRATLAGSAIFFVPSLLFLPAVFGSLPYTLGLSTLIASSVNLHHFVLDGAIWKLRDGRVARALLRSVARDDATTGEAAARRSWARPLVNAAGMLGIAATLFVVYQSRLVFQHPELDHASKRAAAERLAWIGRENPDAFVALAQRSLVAGDDDGALVDYERAVAIYPRQDDLRRIGMIHERHGRLEDALAAYQRVLALNPDHPNALFQSAKLGLALADRAKTEAEIAARRAAAIEQLDRLVQLAPADHEAALLLAHAYEETGQRDRARKLLTSAMARVRSEPARLALVREVQRLRAQADSAADSR